MNLIYKYPRIKIQLESQKQGKHRKEQSKQLRRTIKNGDENDKE